MFNDFMPCGLLVMINQIHVYQNRGVANTNESLLKALSTVHFVLGLQCLPAWYNIAGHLRQLVHRYRLIDS